MDHIANQ